MKIQVRGTATFIYTGADEITSGKQTVVFVHGASLDHTVWTLPARYFVRHGYNVVSVDLPGHGLSGGSPLPKIEQYADWLIELLDALKIKQAAIVGHSMGSLIALDCAGRYTDRVRALALVGTAVPMPVTEQLLNSALENNHAAIEILTQWGHSPQAHFGGNETPGMWMIAGLMRLFERGAKGVLYNDLNACNIYTGGEQAAQNVRCPTRFILGENDMLTPVRAARNLAEKILHAQVDVLQQAGHTIMSEKPNSLLNSLIKIV